MSAHVSRFDRTPALSRRDKVVAQAKVRMDKTHASRFLQGNSHIFDEMFHEKSRIKIVVYDPRSKIRK